MRRDFLSIVRRPADLLKALRGITVGSVIATTGVSLAPAAKGSESMGNGSVEGVTPRIVDKSRKGAKLLLRLPGSHAFLNPEHRSHRSHSSHSSHYSSSGGGASPRAAPPAAAPPPAAGPGTSQLGVASLETDAVSGEIVSIDTDARTITIRHAQTVRTTFAYRDDSKFVGSLGVPVRFDDFMDANAGRLPVTAKDKVQATWRTTPDGKTRIVSTIKKTP